MEFQPYLFVERDLRSKYGGSLSALEWEVMAPVQIELDTMSLVGSQGYREMGWWMFQPALRRPQQSTPGTISFLRRGRISGQLWGSLADLGLVTDYPELLLSINELRREYPRDGSWWSAWLWLPRADGQILLHFRLGAGFYTVNSYEDVREAGVALAETVGNWLGLPYREVHQRV